LTGVATFGNTLKIFDRDAFEGKQKVKAAAQKVKAATPKENKVIKIVLLNKKGELKMHNITFIFNTKTLNSATFASSRQRPLKF
jgi:hypothetical protein